MRVKSAAELRAGMALKITRCRGHGATCNVVLLRPNDWGGLHEHDGSYCEPAKCAGWITSHMDEECFIVAIQDGRLYRLDDDTGAEDYDETPVRREELLGTDK